MPCRDVLSSKQLSELLQEQRVITVRSRASVDQTLRVRFSINIISIIMITHLIHCYASSGSGHAQNSVCSGTKV